MGRKKRRGRNPERHRVVYLVNARPHRVDGEFSLPQAKVILARLKKRGFTVWIETQAGKFVPVKGASRRPGYIDQHGQSVPMGPVMRTVNPLLPGPPPQYVMGAMGAPQLWRYLNIDIELKPPTPSVLDWSACFYLGPAEYDCVTADGPHDALAGARYLIDLEALGSTWKSAELMVDDSINDYTGISDEPVTRSRIARHIETLRKGRWKDNKHVEDFYQLPLPDRLRLIDAVIEKYQRAGALGPAPNPGRIKLVIIDRPACAKGMCLLGKSGRNLEVSGYEIRRLLRDQDRIGGAKMAEILGLVAPIAECDYGGAGVGYDCYKRYYDVPDFERQLQKFAVPDGDGWLWTLKEKRRTNPLLPGPPPQYVMGGMGGPQIWNYRGYDIEVGDSRGGDYVACWQPPDDHRSCALGTDDQGALANARHQIDVVSLGGQWWQAEHAAHMALDHYVDKTTGPVNRGRLARHIEVMSRQRDPSYDILPKYKQAFDNLSLPDRLRLLDEVIDYQERAGLFDPARRTKNPGDDPTGTVCELCAC